MGKTSDGKVVYDAALVLWNYHNIQQPVKACDLIVGLGSYDLRVAHHVAELYLNRVAPGIVLTGGFGNWTRRFFDKPEAILFGDIVRQQGVPSDAVRLECEASNIGENIRFTKAMVAAEPIRSVLIVTKPQTKRRAYATAVKQWPSVRVTVSSPRTSFDEQPTDTHTFQHLVHEMVGDVARLKLYPQLGYQVEQEIPQEVEQAFRMLCDRGYTAHLPAL